MGAHVQLRELVDLALVLSGDLGVGLAFLYELYESLTLETLTLILIYYSNYINLNELVNVSGSSLLPIQPRAVQAPAPAHQWDDLGRWLASRSL